MAAAEALVVARAQSVLVSSPHDVADRATFHLVRSVPVPTPFRWDESRAVGGRLLFVGRLGYAANVEALEWFVEHVMPLLRARGVPATLRIVGAEVSSRVSRLAAPDVEIVGPVADVGVEYASAAVSVVPVRTATGVQMKLIESLGVGTPTVATRLCVELAGSAAEESCRTADTPQEWADHIEQLLGSAGAREAVSASGRRWFESNYAPTAVEGAVSRALDAVDV